EEGPDVYASMLAAPDSLGPGHRPPSESILTISDEQIDQITAQRPFMLPDTVDFQAGEIETLLTPDRVMMPSDVLLTAILTSAIDDRPIYFATTTAVYENLDLRPYLIRQGVAYRLNNGTVAADSASGIVSLRGTQFEPAAGPFLDLPRTDTLAWDVFMHRGGIPDEWSHWVDASTQGIPIYYAYMHYGAAEAHALRGQNEAAQRHIERADAWYDLALR
ncbi:MAG: hypothetical protein ACODAE_06295, partial [Gemmatimonadota bacterium]